MKMTVSKIEHGTVIPCGEACRIPAAAEALRLGGRRGMHYGWPGITRTREGDLLVSASERAEHICPFGRGVVVRSTDNGRTWSEPAVVFDSVTDDRDIAVNTLPDGTVVATWFSSRSWAEKAVDHPGWAPMLERTTPDTLAALSRGWLRRSADGGRTWEERVYPTIVGQHAGPAVLSNGDLVYLGPRRDGPQTVMAVTRSTDGGRTWALEGEVPPRTAGVPGGGRVTFNENHVLEVSPGRLLAVFRCADAAAAGLPHDVHLSRSEDGGRTWSEPEDLGVYGYPAGLVKIDENRLACVFSSRQCAAWPGPRAIRAIFSHDGGRSWDAAGVQVIREFDFPCDMGYPVAVPGGPGEVFCIYYAVPSCRDRDGEGRLIMMPGYDKLDMNEWGILSTRFRVD